jgi:hypothetical protein
LFIFNVDQTAELIDLEAFTSKSFLTGTSKIAYEKYGNDLGKVLVKESNEVMTWLVETGFKFVLSFTHQANFASFKMTLVTVGSSTSLNIKRHKFFGGICLKKNGGGRAAIKFRQPCQNPHTQMQLTSSTSITTANYI